MKDAHANGSLTSLPANAFAGAAETQGLYLYEQLNAGARVFDIRLTDEAPYGSAQDGKSVWLCHGPSPLNVVCSFTYYARDKDKNYLTFENAMTYFTDFLKAHPTETIIMQVTNEHGTGDKASIMRRAKATLDKWKATKNPSTGSSYLYTESDSKNTIDKMPKLRDVRGKIVVVSDVAGSLGYGMSFSTDNNWGWSTMGGVKFSYDSHYSTDNESKVKYLEALHNGTAAKDYDKFANNPQMRAVTSKFSQPASDKNTGVFVYLSSNKFGKGGWWPKSIALWVNPRIVSNNIGVSKDDSKYSGKGLMEESRGQFFGWVNTDYFNDQIGRAIWMTNFPKEGLEYATVSFDANGGSGTMNPVVVQKGSAYALPTGTLKGPNGEVLRGWKVGNEIKEPGTTITVNADTTITAQWSMTLSGLSDLIEKTPSGGTIELTSDVIARNNERDDLLVHDKKELTIKLNGHTIDKASSKDRVMGKHFSIYGALKIVGPGKLTGGYGASAGACSVESGSTLELQDVEVSGNTAMSKAGAIYVREKGTLRISGNTSIQNNKAADNNKTSNVVLAANAVIDVSSALSETARIGVATEKDPAPNAPAPVANIGSGNATLTNFVNDGSNGLALSADGKQVVVVVARKVTFMANDTTVLATAMVEAGSPVAKPTKTPTKAGCTFAGWCTDAGGTVEYDFSKPVTDAMTLYPKWEHGYCTVSFDSAGGSAIAPVKVKYGTQVTEPANPPVFEGHTFRFWATEVKMLGSTTKVKYDFNDPVRNDITLVAAWDNTPAESKDTAPSRTVRFNTGDSGITIDSQKVLYGRSAAEPEKSPQRQHYIFTGWYKNADGTGDPYDFETPVTDDIDLHAGWEPEGYLVYFVSDSDEDIDCQTVKYNATATRPKDPVSDGRTFGGWFTDEGCTQPYDFSTKVTGDTVLYAKWTDIPHEKPTVTFDMGGNGLVSIRQEVEYGGYAKSPDSQLARNGYDFGGWYEDMETTLSNEEAEEIKGDSELNKTYWVTDKNELRHVFSFENTPVTEDLTLYARWIPRTNTVKFIDIKKATETPAGTDGEGYFTEEQQVLSDEFAYDTTGPSSDSRSFAGWFSDKDLTTTFDFTKPILEDTTVYGKWNQAVFDVEFDSAGGSKVSPSTQKVVYGNTAKTPQNPTRTGYSFRGWYQDLTGLVTSETLADVKDQILSLFNDDPATKSAMKKDLDESFVEENGRIYMEYEPGFDKVLGNVKAQALWKPVIVKGEKNVISGMTYKVTKTATDNAAGTVTLVKAKNASTVKVPETIKLRDGKTYKVTAVASGAFKSLAKVKNVTVGANVTTVQTKAFQNLKRLEKVTFGTNVKKVAAGAFKNTPKLKTIVVKGTKLTKKARVAGMLKGSKVKKTIRVKVPAAKRVAYAKVFTKAKLGSPKNVIVK